MKARPASQKTKTRTSPNTSQPRVKSRLASRPGFRSRRGIAGFGLVLASFSFAFSGCSGDGPEVTEIRAGLHQVQSCEELEAYFKDTTLDEMERNFKQMRRDRSRSFFEDNDMGFDGAEEEVFAEAASADDAGTSAPQGKSDDSPDFSETNTQEKGVDEADIVKTDGDYVYHLRGNTLHIMSSFPVEELEEVGSLSFGDALSPWSTQELYVKGDRVVVIRTEQGQDVPEALRSRDGSGSGFDSSGFGGADIAIACAEDGYCGYWGRPYTRVAVIDISDRSAPSIEREHFFEADYMSSRRIDGTLFASFSQATSKGLASSTTQKTGTIAKTIPIRMKSTRFATKNTKRVNEAGLNAWMPQRVERRYKDGDIDSEEMKTISPCNRFYKTLDHTGRGMIDVFTLRLDEETDNEEDSTTVLGHGAIVYSSTEAMYVTAHPYYSWWGSWGRNWQEQPTLIHKFAISGENTQYVASGKTEGRLLNQFSLDEEKGYLRVATTTNQTWDDDGNVTRESQNNLFVLKEENGTLHTVGSVTGLAPGETVHSARFEGDRGYMVTFRQVDPLFTFDLSDPSNPKKMGELKITGFSTYMHPLSEGYILTVGREATETGADRGMKVSIFDVRDLSNPKLVDSEPSRLELGPIRGPL